MTLSQDPNPSEPDVDHASQRRGPVNPAGVVTPPLPPQGQGWGYPPPPPKRFAAVGRIVTGLIGSVLLASIVLNIYLGIWFSSMMAGPSESTYAPGDRAQRIVVLPVNGMISKPTSGFLHDCLAALREDRPTAVILRIDSGGGGVSAADRMWHELVRFKEETGIPIVSSFGSVAASGGYYIAAPTDHIVAEPTSITGSIGVIAQAFTVDQLLGKIGVQPELITATDAYKKDMLNPMRPWTDQDRQALRQILDHAYRSFVRVVAEGRKLDDDVVRTLATGEVYTAEQAQANGLVDSVGYLDDAIEQAKKMAGLAPDSEPMVTVLSAPKRLGLLGLLGHSDAGSVETIDVAQVRRWIGELGTPRLEYRWVR